MSPPFLVVNILHQAQLAPPGGPLEIINSNIRIFFIEITRSLFHLGQVREAKELMSSTSTFYPNQNLSS
jgi:hypothetical protein